MNVRRQNSTVHAYIPLFAVICVVIHATELSGHELSSADTFCGPRCVKFLLEWYGHKPPDLARLINEMQSPGRDCGTSLAQVADALSARGIRTRAVMLSGTTALAFESPVVVHLKAVRDEPLGHFAVWLPNSTETQMNLWMGLRGVMSGPREALAWHIADVVLVTDEQEPSIGGSCGGTRSKSFVLEIPQGLSLLVALTGLVLLLSKGRFSAARHRQG